MTGCLGWERGQRDLKNLEEELEVMVLAIAERHKLDEEQEEFVRRWWRDQTLFIKGCVILILPPGSPTHLIPASPPHACT